MSEMTSSSSVNNPFFQPAKNFTSPGSATTATPPHSTSSAASSKHPRGNKRHKNNNDKSTTTQTTEAVTQQNAFNSILDEADNLCQAATEAQQLGRLQMASTYLLLLHARLVGLGKRFDKSYQNNLSSSLLSKSLKTGEQAAFPKQLNFGPRDNVAVEDETILPNKESTTAPALLKDVKPENAGASQILDTSTNLTLLSSPRSNHSYTPRTNTSTHINDDDKAIIDESSVGATPKTAAARQLASMLPRNIEMDNAMMEHLAKAAAELHAARSTRKKRPRPPVVPQHQLFAAPSLPAVEWELPGVDRVVRKPATAAMNTVPNANCNLKRLLQGDILKPRSKDSAI